VQAEHCFYKQNGFFVKHNQNPVAVCEGTNSRQHAVDGVITFNFFMPLNVLSLQLLKPYAISKSFPNSL